MLVVKRDFTEEPVHFDKITRRIEKLCTGIIPQLTKVDPILVAQKVIQGIFHKIKTSELDNLAAETAAYMSTIESEYGQLAARIAISNLQKETRPKFSECIAELYDNYNDQIKHHVPLVSETLCFEVLKNHELYDKLIHDDRDFLFDYFGFKTLQKSYLKKIKGRTVERPQYMFLRVALGIHGYDIKSVVETYNLMSQKFFIHASPTLFNAGTDSPQMSSCFLLTMKDDSIEGIYETLKQTALISKYAGGIGLSIHNIRANQSYIAGTNGSSSGLIPMLKVFNDTARYVNQGGLRKGSFAVYLEPWHLDIFDFLDLKKNTGQEENRARDLFYAMWIPDLFMRRVKQDQDWSLFCPNYAKGLCDLHGQEFDTEFKRLESLDSNVSRRRIVKAQDLWKRILESQIETGSPYILYKDSCNFKSNQKNLGTIRSSNLCTEIVQYTSDKEIAVCNLASIALPMFFDPTGAEKFNHEKLFEIVQVVTKNLNKVIDTNYYPVREAEVSNRRHRPIGIGVQGLADVFALMRYQFESMDARRLNVEIFETIYYSALWASIDLAKIYGVYETYPGSPASQGLLQFDLWPKWDADFPLFSGRWNWDDLKVRITKYGLRNSLLLAPMPTASTSQILGNNEACEAFTSNIYSRRVLAGEFTVLNHHLIRELKAADIEWTIGLKNLIIANGGSVKGIVEIPLEIQRLFKTVWEISQRFVLLQAAERGRFVCQSQSTNIHIANPSVDKLTGMHFFGWELGLKTGMYYLRTRPATTATQFTVDKIIDKSSDKSVDKTDIEVCTKSEGCISCSS